jgi:signal peptidase II
MLNNRLRTMEQWDNVVLMSVLLITAAIAFLLSLLSTFLVESLLVERVSLIGSFMGFELTRNAGIAFGIDLPQWLLFILIPIALVLIARLAGQSRHHKISSVAFGLILGGALGNIVDRLDDGFVTDFVQIGWWPTFNIADSCITVGVCMLLLYELWKSPKSHILSAT